MKSRKTLNTDGSTNKIIIQNDSGSYSAYTPIQAARMILELTAQLKSGIPIVNNFRQMRG